MQKSCKIALVQRIERIVPLQLIEHALVDEQADADAAIFLHHEHLLIAERPWLIADHFAQALRDR